MCELHNQQSVCSGSNRRCVEERSSNVQMGAKCQESEEES